MSSNALYWLFTLLAFGITLLMGFVLMQRTKKLWLSFGISTLFNTLMTVFVCVWWAKVTDDSYKVLFYNMFYLLGYVNVIIIDFFALLSMRKKAEGPVKARKKTYEEEYGDS
ncbi:hypothetical protein [Paenibacillus sp. FJAT-26967]|uniref:hypothetical protein n=1 Tax=Paenibacillus sp. FJAT-26967 TaxID=1729690 RepID=UPI000837EF41|nr:hypothetical protein [Paenibacillus sp. FJAT-26967]